MSSANRPVIIATPPTYKEKIAKVKNCNYYFETLKYVYLEAAPKFLRQVFRDLWQRVMGSPWQDNKGFLKKLLEVPGASSFLRLGSNEAVKCGNSSAWDLSLLLDVIWSLVPQLSANDFLELYPTIVFSGMTMENFDMLKKLMAVLGLESIKDVKEDDLKWSLGLTTEILAIFGMTSDLLKMPKNQLKTPEMVTRDNASPESAKKAEEFRLAGNELFKKNLFTEAAAEYSKGINLKDVPRELLGTLYSNRSIANLEAKYIAAAKEDAKRCVILRPEWFRGYARLGKVYEKLKKFHKANGNFTIAVNHGDSSKSTLEGHRFCKLSIRRVNINQVSSNADLSQSSQYVFSWPGIELCIMGLRHLNGAEGFRVDYNKAAEFFSNAANLGDAFGLYNLGKMHQEGKGFKKDTAKAHALFLKAATQDPLKESVIGTGEIVTNFGVAESCHEIGLAYDPGFGGIEGLAADMFKQAVGWQPDNGGVEGVGVDAKKALEWYHKALEFGWHRSAYEIGVAFSLGIVPGFPVGNRTNRRGLEYWKLGAHLKDLSSAEYLAMFYSSFDKLTEAQEWFHFASLNGSTKLEERRAEFVRDEQLERKFNAEKFAEELAKDVRGSAVVGPVLKKIEDIQRRLKSPEV